MRAFVLSNICGHFSGKINSNTVFNYPVGSGALTNNQKWHQNVQPIRKKCDYENEVVEMVD